MPERMKTAQIKILKNFKNYDDKQHLQHDLDKLKLIKWLEKWQMLIDLSCKL